MAFEPPLPQIPWIGYFDLQVYRSMQDHDSKELPPLLGYIDGKATPSIILSVQVDSIISAIPFRRSASYYLSLSFFCPYHLVAHSLSSARGIFTSYPRSLFYSSEPPDFLANDHLPNALFIFLSPDKMMLRTLGPHWHPSDDGSPDPITHRSFCWRMPAASCPRASRSTSSGPGFRLRETKPFHDHQLCVLR